MDENLLRLRSSGILPPTLTLMVNRINIYQGGELQNNLVEPKEWIKCRENISMEILNLPPSPDNMSKSIKTPGENIRLLTIDQLNYLYEKVSLENTGK